MNKLLSSPNIYVILWCLYFMQGILFDESSSYSQILLIVLILLSGYAYYKLFYKNKIKSLYIKWTNILFCFFLIYGFIFLISGKTAVISRSGTVIQSFGFIKQMMVSYLPLFTIYYFSRKRKVSDNDIRWWSILFLVTAIVFFYVERMNALRFAAAMNLNRTEFTNNSAYFFVAVIPLLVLWKKSPIIQYVLFFICLVFIVISMKRGAILCGGLVSLLFLKETMTFNRKKRGYVLILFAVAFYTLSVYISDFLIHSDLFVSRIEETISGNTSGRDMIASDLLNHFFNQNSVLGILFGEGANATLKYAENYAHNDWLEIAVCEGIIGLVVYLLYWKAFYKTVTRINPNKTAYFVCKSYLLLFFVRSFFSQSFNDVIIFASLSLGFYIYMAEQSKIDINNKNIIVLS